MGPNYTPLRYPGGKAKLGPYLSTVLRFNRLFDTHFVEPFAGGSGAALFLLMRGYVKTIHLNDIDPAVASFWRAVIQHPRRFVQRIESVPLTVEEWERQRLIYTTLRGGFELGFAFFFLNRTNRSGIMNAGVIGGKQQTGKWGIDARFNRAELAERVRLIGTMRHLITVSSDDALDLLAKLDVRRRSDLSKLFVYLDPPYFTKGRDLYTNFYVPEDHAVIARKLRKARWPWLLTYDDCPEIRALYSEYQMRESELSYSAREVRRGREIVVFGPGVRPPVVSLQREGFRLLDEKDRAKRTE
jgi:DNA adenine methylase